MKNLIEKKTPYKIVDISKKNTSREYFKSENESEFLVLNNDNYFKYVERDSNIKSSVYPSSKYKQIWTAKWKNIHTTLIYQTAKKITLVKQTIPSAVVQESTSNITDKKNSIKHVKRSSDGKFKMFTFYRCACDNTEYRKAMKLHLIKNVSPKLNVRETKSGDSILRILNYNSNIGNIMHISVNIRNSISSKHSLTKLYILYCN